MSNARSRRTPARSTEATVSVETSHLPAIESLDALDFGALATEAMAAGADPDTARAYATERLAEYVAADAVEGKAKARKSVLASLATYAVFKAGVLSETKVSDADREAGLMDFESWGKHFAETTGGTATSVSSVRTWLRAGEAMVEWNLDPDSREAYALLGGLAQSGLWNARRTEVRAALAAKRETDPDAKVTSEEIARTVREIGEAEAERKRKAKATREANREATKAATEAAAAATPVERIQAILAGMDVEAARAVLTECMAWLDSEGASEGDAA